jgi:apolipoprotein N-acyltransferase
MAPFALVGMAGGLALFWALAWGLAARFGGRGRLGAVALGGGARRGRGAARLRSDRLSLGAARPCLDRLGADAAGGLRRAARADAADACWSRRSSALRRRGPAWGAAALLPFAALYGLGAWQGARPLPASGGAGGPAGAAQRGAASEMGPGDGAGLLSPQVEFTARAPEGPPPDLIVWPETAVPTLLHNAGPVLDEIAAAAGGVPVVLGIQRLDGGARLQQPVVVLGRAAGSRRSTTSTTWCPSANTCPSAGAGAGRAVGLRRAPGLWLYRRAGPGADRDRRGGHRVAADLLRGDLSAGPARRAGRADFILQITNDAWFGQISGPYQHLAQARLRASSRACRWCGWPIPASRR